MKAKLRIFDLYKPARFCTCSGFLKEPPPFRAAVHQETEIIFRCKSFYTCAKELLISQIRILKIN
jgi:hypothetical protein